MDAKDQKLEYKLIKNIMYQILMKIEAIYFLMKSSIFLLKIVAQNNISNK